MSRNKRIDIVLEGLLVESVAAEGKAIAHTDDGMVVFIEFAVPGDIGQCRSGSFPTDSVCPVIFFEKNKKPIAFLTYLL